MKSKTGLFSYSDALDKLLMLFGTLGSIGDGSMTPLTMFILSGLINVSQTRSLIRFAKYSMAG